MSYQTIKVRFQGATCFLQLHRPEANNTINAQLVEECLHVLALCEESVSVLVLEGLPDVFCLGADFQGIRDAAVEGSGTQQRPGPLYELWTKLAQGPYVTVSLARGRTNAGGVGFLAASDIVLADQAAQFSLSELLFGLFPALVLPFLVRRIGYQKANYLTLMTHAVSVQQAQALGLVDAWDADPEALLRKHLLRLKCLSKTGVASYKRYMGALDPTVSLSRDLALEANRQIFSDPLNLQGIVRYVETGEFPWSAR